MVNVWGTLKGQMGRPEARTGRLKRHIYMGHIEKRIAGNPTLLTG